MVEDNGSNSSDSSCRPVMRSQLSERGAGSLRTSRRAWLRRNAEHRIILKALMLFSTVVAAARNSNSAFGRRLSSSVTKGAKLGRARDLVPLPYVSGEDGVMHMRTIHTVRTVLHQLVNATVEGLNFLHGGRCVTGRISPSLSQRAALQNITMRWWQLGRVLARRDGNLTYNPTAYADLVARKTASGAKPLLASGVDVLSNCSDVDAQAFLPSDLRTIVESSTSLLIEDTSKLNPIVEFGGGSRSEYALLLIKQFRAGKISLGLDRSHAEIILFLPKRTSGAMREVWNGKCLSEATIESPEPPWLSSPSCLANLEASDDRPLLLSA